MHGLLQRFGSDSKQDLVFSDVLLRDLTALLKADYARAHGSLKL
jgi:hypothetical protein